MSVQIFVDRAPWVDTNPEYKRLFDEFGCEAYDMIFDMQMQDAREREERDYLTWAPNLGDPDDEDDAVDYGPEELDEYGGD